MWWIYSEIKINLGWSLERMHCAQILSFHQWCKYCELNPGTYGLKLNNEGNEVKYPCIYVHPKLEIIFLIPPWREHISVAFYEIYEEIGLIFRDFNSQLIFLIYTDLLCEEAHLGNKDVPFSIKDICWSRNKSFTINLKIFPCFLRVILTSTPIC